MSCGMKYELQIQNMCIGADILITALKTLREKPA